MTKSKAKPFYTTSRLFERAAELVHSTTNNHDGTHKSIYDAVREIKIYGKFSWPISARRRATKILDYLYGDCSFGKTYSESLNPHAINNVIRNRDHRVTALLIAGEFAAAPIRRKIKRVDTSPTK